ncbi:hypothetical protein FOL47_000352, partial [Perkinsus chesapeaki]
MYDGYMHQACIDDLDSLATLKTRDDIALPTAVFCEYLVSRGVVNATGCDSNMTDKASAEKKNPSPAGNFSMLYGKRGWGNDRATHSTAVESVQECATYCASLKACQWFTFDSTAMYGARMCWAWSNAYPDEIRDEEDGWMSMNWTDFIALSQSTYSKSGDNYSARLLPASRIPMRERMGQRYALISSGKGRCVDATGDCECFPPFRGIYCSMVDDGLSLDGKRPYRGVLHYLTSNLSSDVDDLSHSLPILWQRWNGRYDYPVI